MLAIAFLGCLKLSLSLPSHLRLWWWMVRVGEEQDRFVQYSCRPPNPARCNATALPTQSQHSSINPARKSILPPKSRISITLAQQQTERKRGPFSFKATHLGPDLRHDAWFYAGPSGEGFSLIATIRSDGAGGESRHRQEPRRRTVSDLSFV